MKPGHNNTTTGIARCQKERTQPMDTAAQARMTTDGHNRRDPAWDAPIRWDLRQALAIAKFVPADPANDVYKASWIYMDRRATEEAWRELAWMVDERGHAYAARYVMAKLRPELAVINLITEKDSLRTIRAAFTELETHAENVVLRALQNGHRSPRPTPDMQAEVDQAKQACYDRLARHGITRTDVIFEANARGKGGGNYRPDGKGKIRMPFVTVSTNHPCPRWVAQTIIHEIAHAVTHRLLADHHQQPHFNGAHSVPFQVVMAMMIEDCIGAAAAREFMAHMHATTYNGRTYSAISRDELDQVMPPEPAPAPEPEPEPEPEPTFTPEPADAEPEPTGWDLRDEDQRPLVDAAKASTAKRTMIQAETGAGKTVMGSTIAADAAAEGKTVVWAAHRAELLDQAEQALIRAGATTQRWADTRTVTPGVVTLLSTAAKTWPVGGVDLLMVDEAHHSIAPTWRTLITTMAATKTYGLTATPLRTNPWEGFTDLWGDLITGPTYGQLVMVDALAPYRYLEASAGARVSRQQLVTDQFGEFTTASTEVVVTRLLSTGAATREWARAAAECDKHSNGDKRTIWFVPSCKSAAETADTLRSAGMTAATLTGQNTRTERDAIMSAFRAGSLTHLVTVDIATEGLDVPECGIVVHLRPTTSLTLHRQMNGRALRWAPGKVAIILCLVGNVAQHGTPDRPIKWTLKPRGERSYGDAITSECPVCRHNDGLPKGDAECHRNHVSRHSCTRCGSTLQFDCYSCSRRLTWRQYTRRDDRQAWAAVIRDEYRECGECCEAKQQTGSLLDWDSLLTVDPDGQIRLLI